MIYKNITPYRNENSASYPSVPSNTLRFMFSKSDYDPTEAGVGSSGTWAKKTEFPNANVWDWTNPNTDWQEAFKGAFPDADNEVRVIAAGDTSNVTKMDKLFAGAYTNNPNQTSYSLSTRNNVVSCVSFDVSEASISFMFTGTTLKKFVEFYTTEPAQGIFADSFIEEIGDVSFKCSSSAQMFARCSKLKRVGILKFDASVLVGCASLFWSISSSSVLEYVGGIEGTGNCQNVTNLFSYCKKLKHIDGEIDCSSVTNCTAMFNGCYVLENIPVLKNLGNSNVSSCYAAFVSCRAVKELPLFDTSHVTDARSMFDGCRNIETIPDYDFSSVTNVNNLVSNTYNVKYGILETYNKLLARGASITNHTDCFKNCGINTPEGQIALSQIPASWGGTGT